MTKAELISIIDNLEDETFLNVLKETVMAYKTDFWDTLSESEQKEIDLGIDQLDNGQRISYAEIERKTSARP
jgi:hypothetical protein